jgi:hypothetical protein
VVETRLGDLNSTLHYRTDSIIKSWAKKLTNQLKLDPSEGFEEAKCAKGLLFPGDITISSLEEAEIEAITKYPGLTI